MDFTMVIVVLLTYFIRPQDWVPGMSGLNIMNLLMALAILGMFLRRGGVSPASILKTPMDWAMLAYAAYIILAAPSGQKPIIPVVIFLAYYMVTSQALTTAARMRTFLRCWLGGLIVVAAMAVASEYGFDLTGAQEITHAVPEKPRLVLNTYLFNNANSLGHSIVVVIPLAYFLFFSRKPARLKILFLLAATLAAACVYMTKSKGAYLVGFTVMVAALMIGRPILFQIITLLIAGTLGLEGLRQMPRMADMERVRQDEAVMGRMLAWEQARRASQEDPQGMGFKNFQAIIEWEEEELFKATHSSYVLIGAELGTRGMLFYLAVLYAGLRILMTTRCKDPEDDTSRKAMMVILLGYMGSGWLIDRSYHLEYFLLAGAVSAFHRRLGTRAGLIEPSDDEFLDEETLADTEDVPSTPPGPGQAVYGFAAGPADDIIRGPGDIDTDEAIEAAIEEEKFRFWFWRRWGLLDLVLVALFSKLVIDIWDRLLETYFL